MIGRRKILLTLVLGLLAFPAAARADFGIAPGSLAATALNENGSIDTRAGTHPFSYTVHFDLNVNGSGLSEGGEMRNILFEAPPGLIGNPQAVSACPRERFEGGSPNCKSDTQIGVVRAIVGGIGEVFGPLYNLAPRPGTPVEFGFSAGGSGLSLLQSASLRTEEDYGVNLLAPDLPVEVTSVTATIWGVPADEQHTPERFCVTKVGAQKEGCPTEGPLLPFLTLPTSCQQSPVFTVRVESKQPGVFDEQSTPTRDKGGNPVTLANCAAVPFSPTVLNAPTTEAAGSASGLDFVLGLPNKGLLDPNGVTETEPVKTVVSLPRGVTANPAAASGLAACSEQQFKDANGEPGVGCPESSKLGTLVAQTPLLEEAIEGSVYLATPDQNRFGSLLALYIVARAGERGVLVKQAGEVQADPQTGQLTTTFDGLPPLPYSSFELRLREGPRAPLITPQLCGNYTTTAQLYPFSAPGTPVERTAPFKITTGAAGACAATEADLPNRPSLEAGTLTPLAGAYSPFVFRLSRSDADQRFGSLSAVLPEGLTGRLAGIPYCPEQAIAAAQARGQDGGGALELAAPSCPSASEVGVANVAAGAGPQPYYVQGKVYLAGPYKGAPLSLVVVTPAIAGPFDLGVVAVRAALYVDEFSSRITVQSDPLPTILHGIPLDVRSIAVKVERDGFTLNPTSCEAKAIRAEALSVTGSVAQLSNRFQVGGCGGLGFAPKLSLSLKGPTRRSGHPALKAVVTYPQGGSYANIARAQVGLPHSEFLDQGNLDNVCTQPQLRSRSCPASSVYGHAKAWTPLLDKPLEGPVYLGVGFGYKLPALVADLDGQVRILLKGKVDTTKHNGLRNTFEAVPDAPVSRFVLEMKGGKKYGLLENSENVCRRPQRASASFTAQNVKTLHLQPKIANSCKESR